jgi:hypothetical protein
MADMHRPGRVGRDIFDVDLLAGADGLPAKIGALLKHRDQQLAPEIVLELQIDEARPRDVRPFDIGILGQFGDDTLGQSARVLAGGFGQHHRRVGGQIAMGRIARRFHRDARSIDRSTGIVFQVKSLDDFCNPTGEVGEDVHSYSLCATASLRAASRGLAPTPNPGFGQTAAGVP